jgi:hypothetical protein
MTDRKRQLLVDELEDAVGPKAVEQTDLDFDRALEPRTSRLAQSFRSARLLLLVVGGALLVVGVIASLALESWVFFGLAIAAHALFSVVVIGSAMTLVEEEEEKPSATAEAALEEEGVRDPSAALGDLVDQVESRRNRPS